MRSAIRCSLSSPEATAACSTNCRMLSCRIAIRLLSSDSDNVLSLLMMHPPGGAGRRGFVQSEACPPDKFFALMVGTAQAPLPTLRISLLLHRLQQRDVIGNRRTAHVEDASELGILDLHAFGRLTDKLHRRHHMHGNAGRTDRMALCLQPA